MKKLLAIAALAFSAQLCNAMSLVTLPDAQTLTQRLNAKGFEELVAHTNIIAQLAGQELLGIGVNLKVELCLVDYARYIQTPIVIQIMRARKQDLLNVILADYPASIEELKAILPKALKNSL